MIAAEQPYMLLRVLLLACESLAAKRSQVTSISEALCLHRQLYERKLGVGQCFELVEVSLGSLTECEEPPLRSKYKLRRNRAVIAEVASD